jgi:hypothetical protein
MVKPIGNMPPRIPFVAFGRQMAEQLANVRKRGQRH